MTWEEVDQALADMRHLAEGWDDEGSPPPDPLMLKWATRCAADRREQLLSPPDRVVAGVNGDINFEFLMPDGGMAFITFWRNRWDGE